MRAPVPDHQRRGPRRVDVFHPDAIQKIGEEPPTAETADERVRRRLAAWDRQLVERGAPNILTVEPGVEDLGRRLYGWFMPSEDSLMRHGLRPIPWTALLPSSPLLEVVLGGDSDYVDSPAQRAWVRAFGNDDDGRDDRGVAALPLFCFGACGQSHDVAALHVVIDVDHDELGLPTKWRLSRPSGDGELDNAALAAIGDSSDWTPPESIARGRRPLRTRWVFSADAYQWSRLELILDPLFEPPGATLERTSGVGGVTTLVKTVRLVAVVYRPSASSSDGAAGTPGAALAK